MYVCLLMPAERSADKLSARFWNVWIAPHQFLIEIRLNTKDKGDGNGTAMEQTTTIPCDFGLQRLSQVQLGPGLVLRTQQVVNDQT